MNPITQKILELIKTDSELGPILFGYDIPDENNNPEEYKEYGNVEITWLFITHFYNVLPWVAGIKPGSDDIYSVLDARVYLLCKGLENMPYEVLRRKCYYIEDCSVAEVFDDEPEFKIALEKYENWCKVNGIELDKDKIYHDENGKLFTHFLR